MVCKSKGLSFSSPPLIQGQCCLPPPSCCSCTRTQLGQPFEEAKALSPHNRHAEGSPYLAQYLYKETQCSFIPRGSFNGGHSWFSKELQELVKMRWQVTPRAGYQLPFYNFWYQCNMYCMACKAIQWSGMGWGGVRQFLVMTWSPHNSCRPTPRLLFLLDFFVSFGNISFELKMMLRRILWYPNISQLPNCRPCSDYHCIARIFDFFSKFIILEIITAGPLILIFQCYGILQ